MFEKDLEIITESNDVDLKALSSGMVKKTISFSLPFLYKKLKNGYECYCPNCQEYIKYNDDQFKQIRYSKVCPKCRCNIRKDNFKEYSKPRVIYMFQKSYKSGYEIDVKFSWKRKPKAIVKQVLKIHREKYKTWYEVKEICITGYGWSQCVKPCWVFGEIWEANKKWHYSYSDTYAYFFSDLIQEYKPHTKKEILNNYKGLNLKSNQIKMILDYPFSENQIYAIKIFNLKTPEEVYKNRAYIKSLRREYDNAPNTSIEFNIQTLEYLKKNKIDYNLYIDYAVTCKAIGRKIDKPKDFNLWHDRVMEMYETQKDKIIKKKIIEIGKELSKNNYKKKDITIKAFTSITEINQVSKSLHNCMSRLYIEPYAKRDCDLYHLDINNKPTLAIEIVGNKLNQCYGNNNEKPPKNLQRIVDNWCKEMQQAY